MSRRHDGLIAGLAVLIVLTGSAAAAADPAPPHVTTPPAVSGSVVEGQTLTAVGAQWTGSPEPTATYSWLRCGATGPPCAPIAGATGTTYALTAQDVGLRIAVRLTVTNQLGSDSARSSLTNPVAPAPAPEPQPEPAPAPQPEPEPAPQPEPQPAPPPASEPAPASSITAAAPAELLAAAAPAAALPVLGTPPGAPRRMQPFPRVRMRGSLLPGGALVSLLSVRGPVGARIEARCRGRLCPLGRGRYRAVSRVTRLRAFERFLPAGVRLVIKVTRPGTIGKETDFRIRAGVAPERLDRCLVPGRARATRCTS